MRRTIILSVMCTIALANLVCAAGSVYPDSVSWTISGLVLIVEAYFLGEIRGESRVSKKFIKFIEEEFERSKETEKEYEELKEELINEKDN